MSDVGMTDTNAMRPGITGNDIWELLFGILKGDVPDEMTEEVCDELALALLATDRAAGVGEEALVYANCKGMIGDLPGGRDPEEFCDTCYRDALAASLPAPADASSLDPLLCRCENARRKGIPMLCVQCTGPVGSQTAAGAK